MYAPTSTDEVDPSQAATTAQFGACLRALRTAAGLSLRDVEGATRSSAPGLARSTIQSVEQGKHLPKPDWLAAYLSVCGVPDTRQRVWLRTRAAVAVDHAGFDTASGRLPRVDACSPRRLGVHASITIPTRGTTALRDRQLPELPQYVPRDADEEVRGAIVEAAGQGGLVAVVGNSSTGKTRTVYEAVNAELPGWWLFHPADAAELAAVVTGRKLPSGTVVWLDEAQQYLAGPNRLTVGTARALLDPDRPVVVVATMWPQWYEQFTAVPPVEPGGDTHCSARQILSTMARVIRLTEFSRAERDRAAALRGEDPRLGIALQDSNFGPTQVLAGAPQLVDRWDHATDPYAKAVMTAAIDLRRLGHLAPLSAELLRAAAPGYLTDQQKATAVSDWFTCATAYATTPLHGATSALIPVAGARMGEIVGYEVADYLLQHGQAIRKASAPPRSMWDAATAQTATPDDRTRLGSQASHRGLYRHAVLLLTSAAEDDDAEAMRLLSIKYSLKFNNRNEAMKWNIRAIEIKDPGALRWLANVHRRFGYLQDAEKVLRDLADANDRNGRYDLAMLLYATDREQEGEELLHTLGKNGDADALWELAERLNGTGRLRDEEQVLTQLAASGDKFAMEELAGQLQRQGRVEEAERWLGRATRNGNAMALLSLAGLLAQQNRDHEANDCLLQAAERVDGVELIDWLERHHRSKDSERYLRHGAEAGNIEAMLVLGEMLDERGNEEAEDWLRQAADAGAIRAFRRLGACLSRQGREEEVEESLRSYGASGHTPAMSELADLLERQVRLKEAEEVLRQATEIGASSATKKLAELLERTNRSQEAARLGRFGIEPGGRTADPW